MTQSEPNSSPWRKAARLCELSGTRASKADALLSEVTFQSSVERRRCQFLFYGVLRHRRRIETLLTGLIPRRPKPRLWAMLEIAVYELMEAGPERQPKVVDYAVGEIRKTMGKGEAGLANAVLRKIPAANTRLETTAPAAIRTSHPDWLASKWEKHFGPEAAEQFMRWNLQTPEVCLRVRDEAGVELAEAQAMAAGEGELFEPTQWPGFVALAGNFSRAEPLLKSGALYAQDASTRLATEVLAVKPGEHVLDLCAAPGGKTLMLADALGADTSGFLVAVELPGPRLEQLDENLQKVNDGDGPAVSLLSADVLALTSEHFAELGLPDRYDAVLLDAPCSNTGVLRRRPDAKWRLAETDITESALLQRMLLSSAAARVKPGGRLVYSTCSIEPEENEDVVAAFLASDAGQRFSLTSQQTYLPWECGHDGAGVALLQSG